MKIKILNSCYVEGKIAQVGDIIDVSDKVAKLMFSMQRAEPAPEKETKQKVVKNAKRTAKYKRS